MNFGAACELALGLGWAPLEVKRGEHLDQPPVEEEFPRSERLRQLAREPAPQEESLASRNARFARPANEEPRRTRYDESPQTDERADIREMEILVNHFLSQSPSLTY